MVSGTKRLATDPLSPLRCEVGTPWIGLIIPHRCLIRLRSGNFDSLYNNSLYIDLKKNTTYIIYVNIIKICGITMLHFTKDSDEFFLLLALAFLKGAGFYIAVKKSEPIMIKKSKTHPKLS